jgi:hypothetical protein
VTINDLGPPPPGTPGAAPCQEPHPSVWTSLFVATNQLLHEAVHYALLGPLAAYYDRIEELWFRVRDLRRLAGWGDGRPLEESGLSVSQPADWEKLDEWLVRLRLIRNGAWYESQRCPRRTAAPAPAAAQYVTLGQMALILRVAKRTLERLRVRPQNPFPAPDIKGKGRGKASWWVWAQVRPWLAREFGARLPEHFPDFFAPQ